MREGGKILIFFITAFASVLNVTGNNVRITKELRVTDITSGIATLEIGLAWDNSWRDEFNWDAVWLFLKYKEVSDKKIINWEPLYPQKEGHHAGTDFLCIPGITNNRAVGILISRAKVSNGNCNVTCQIKWELPIEFKNYSIADFENQKVIFLVQGIEMVFLPYKAFHAGDGVSWNSIGDSLKRPLVIGEETLAKIDYWESDLDRISKVNLGRNFPKGYRGIYLMKYEISQEQYVRFLNALTREQQEILLPHLTKLKEGHYLFGEGRNPSCRNGIYLVRKPKNGSPMHFENNLRNDDKWGYLNDGQTIACNYMGPVDMSAYCAWAGLRPMSELEYEKAGRRLYPQEPEAGEYAWNNAVDPVFVSSIRSSGMTTETVDAAANVNAGGLLEGPVRCGAFARSNGNQMSSGGSYWGVMELSGNLKELCYNINAGNVFDGTVQGEGYFNMTFWNEDEACFGVRGGSFKSGLERLRISDRAEINYYKGRGIFYRDSSVTFRGVRVAESGTIDPGKISCEEGEVVCRGLLVHILNEQEAKVEGMEGLSAEYLWSVNGVLVEGETGGTLTYLLPQEGKEKNYTFVRKAVTAVGESEISLVLRIPDVPFNDISQLFENPGSVMQVTLSEDWKTNVPHICYIEGAPSGVTVNNAAQISGVTDGTFPLFKFKIAPALCPQEIYEKEIRIARYYDYTGKEQVASLPAGSYKMECWGARGGGGYNTGGNGGYTSGKITLTGTRAFYIHVGQQGGISTATTYGGGGGGGISNKNWGHGGQGGGASDIRLLSGSWEDVKGLRSRIMVAGGGGGGQHFAGNGYYTAGAYGGIGGGLVGGNSRNCSGSVVPGGTQATGYTLGIGERGRNSVCGNNCSCEGNGGGGGGYYGGKAFNGTGVNSDAGGGGGSSFISGYAGCDAMNISGVHTGSSQHYSGLIFENSTMQSGVNSGKGKVRIERLK